MPRCPYCPLDPVSGKKVVHRSIRRDCPTLAARKAQQRGSDAAARDPGDPAPTTPGAAGQPGAGTAPAAPKPEGKAKRKFGWLTRKSTRDGADAVARGAAAAQAAKPVEEFDWELSDEVHGRLWIAGVGFVKSILNLINVQLLGIPELPSELLRLGKSDIDALNDGFKGATSKFLYDRGFRTLESATRFVNSFTMVSTFGLQGIQVAIWYIKNVPNSPKVKAWREKQRQIIAERRAANARQARERGELELRPELGAGEAAA